MTKVEGFIKDCTKNFSNDIEQNVDGLSYLDYVPWLTPEQALRAVEIAREKIVNEVCDYIKNNLYKYLYVCDGEAGFPTAQFINDLKQAINADK